MIAMAQPAGKSCRAAPWPGCGDPEPARDRGLVRLAGARAPPGETKGALAEVNTAPAAMRRYDSEGRAVGQRRLVTEKEFRAWTEAQAKTAITQDVGSSCGPLPDPDRDVRLQARRAGLPSRQDPDLPLEAEERARALPPGDLPRGTTWAPRGWSW